MFSFFIFGQLVLMEDLWMSLKIIIHNLEDSWWFRVKHIADKHLLLTILCYPPTFFRFLFFWGARSLTEEKTFVKVNDDEGRQVMKKSLGLCAMWAKNVHVPVHIMYFRRVHPERNYNKNSGCHFTLYIIFVYHVLFCS